MSAPRPARTGSKVRTGGALMKQPGAEERWAQFVAENAPRYTPEKCADLLDSCPTGLGRLLSFVDYARRGR